MRNKAICALLLVAILLQTAAPVAAADMPAAEPYTSLYVVYEGDEEPVITIELRNQRELANGAVSALVSVRAESLIAYNLTFEAGCSYYRPDGGASCTSGDYLQEIDFLPLYPGRVYDLGTITFEPGSYFTVEAAKFGTYEDVLIRMTLIQLALLPLYLVGTKPPMEWHELPRTVVDSFSIVPNPTGAIASLLAGVHELMTGADEPLQAILNIADGLQDVPAIWDFVAAVYNLIIIEGPRMTGDLLKGIFKVANIIARIGDAKRTIDAFNQMRNHPALVTATITPAPIVTGERPERYRVLEFDEPFDTEIAILNRGSEYWVPNQGYELWVMVESSPLNKLLIDRQLGPGHSATWLHHQTAPALTGIYHLSYQMALNGRPIGPPVPAEIVVVPPNSDSLIALLEAIIEDVKAKAGDRLDEMIAELEDRIKAAIVEAALAELQRLINEICAGLVGVAMVAMAVAGSQHRSRRKVKHDEHK